MILEIRLKVQQHYCERVFEKSTEFNEANILIY